MKRWVNSWTEVEELGRDAQGRMKYAATISVGHQVFKDKTDRQWKKRKLTDNRPGPVIIQGARCCTEVYPYYAKYFDVDHEEVRLHEARWVVQRLFKEPDKWRDVGAWNPVMKVEEGADFIKVTVTYDTSYGPFILEYLQRDRAALKHNVYFTNESGGAETFRVLQRWAGIVGEKCNGRDFPLDVDSPSLKFHRADRPKREFTIHENLWGMVLNLDGSEKTDQCLQRHVAVEAHAQGMKADFIYGNWTLSQDEGLEIDPLTATLNNPTEDGHLSKGAANGSYAIASAACVSDDPARSIAGSTIFFGGYSTVGAGHYESRAYRGYVEWPIGALAGFILIANPVLKYEGNATLGTFEEINPLTEEQPSNGGCTDVELWDYIASGVAYVDPWDVVVAATQSQDLGAAAKTDLQAAMNASQSWFAIGFQSPDDECPDTGPLNVTSAIYSENKAGPAADPPPTLYVEYHGPPIASVSVPPLKTLIMTGII